MSLFDKGHALMREHIDTVHDSVVAERDAVVLERGALARSLADTEAALVTTSVERDAAVAANASLTDERDALLVRVAALDATVLELQAEIDRLSAEAEPSAVYGPVARSAPDAPYVTPEEYGAVGDGSTDDTVAVQSALDAAVGGTLWLPADKTYVANAMLVVESNTTVIGAGPTSVIRFTWTGVNSPEGSVNVRTGGPSSQNIHLSNFVFEGAGNGLPGGIKSENPEGLVPLLKLIRLDNFSLTRMEIRNAEGLSVTATGCTNGEYRHNWIHHSGRDGITHYRNQTRNTANITIDSNLIEKVGDDCVAINGLVPGHDITPPADGSNPLPDGFVITNNVLRQWESDPNGMQAGRGIALNGTAGALVQNNDIAHIASTGILLTGCNDHICSGSSTDWWSEGAEIVGNKISHVYGGSRPGAIAVIKSNDCRIVDNEAIDTAPYDFSGAANSVVEGNTRAPST